MQQFDQVQPRFTKEAGHLIMYHQEETGLSRTKDANVNDRDRMQDLLSQEKYLTQSYAISVLEAGNEELVRVMKQNMDQTLRLQRQIFNVMFKKGWYRMPVADVQAVSRTYEQFRNYQSQWPFPPSQDYRAVGYQQSSWQTH